MLLVLYRDFKKGVPAQPAPHQIKKRHTKQKKDALNVNSTHPIISKL